jgi:hypothetical protein
MEVARMTGVPRQAGRGKRGTLLRPIQNHRRDARDLFYQALRFRAPDVMDKLVQRGLASLEPKHMLMYVATPQETWQNIAPLGPFVVKWAKRHNLSADWIVVDTIGYLLSLKNGDFEGDEAPCILSGLTGVPIIENVELHLPAFGWHSELESWADFEKRVRRGVNKELKRHRDQIVGPAKEKDYSTLDRPELWRDMQRVVLRVVLDLSPAEILLFEDRLGVERGVQESIRAGCELLGLPPAPVGRPKKPRSRSVRVQEIRN